VALKRPLHAEDRSVDQLVLKLRRKLTSHGASERVILSVRRQGYVISDSTMFHSLPHHQAEDREPAGALRVNER
jgi:DNA-binding winged helix-turn-helix (wHTH) protein